MQRKVTHSLQLIATALEKYGDKIAIFSSFGKDSVVTLHLCRRINPQIQVVSIMTPYKPQETLDYKKHLTDKWQLNIKTYCRELITENDKNIYDIDVDRCCQYYKVAPSRQAIRELQLGAWISGLRGTEGHTRKFLQEIEERDGLIKINPILEWTEADVWLYHSANNIAPHPLYMQGYRSLGCAPCSMPYADTERGGRWIGTEKACGECGIHTQSLVKGEENEVVKDVYGIPKRDGGLY